MPAELPDGIILIALEGWRCFRCRSQDAYRDLRNRTIFCARCGKLLKEPRNAD